MGSFTIRGREDAEDFVRGCTFFGTGGGGSPEYGLRMLLGSLSHHKIVITDPESINDNSWTICAYGMGSIAPRTPKILEEMKSLGLERVKVKYKLAEAINDFQDYLGVKIGAIVPLEIGGANTPDPVATAAYMGINVVDGDYSGGRAIPEIIQTSPHIAGLKMNPLASVDEWGNRVLIRETVNNLVAEKIGKLVSILAYGNLAGNATYLIKAKRMKRLIARGTLSRALSVGRIIRQVSEEGNDIAKEIAERTEGYLLFKGRIIEKKDEDRDGYYWGMNTLSGIDEFDGHTFKYWYKNENHITYLDGKEYVTSPDLICVINLDNSQPLTNPASKVGDRIAIIGYRANKAFRSSKALDVLGPRHFGFNFDYRPIEEVVKS